MALITISRGTFGGGKAVAEQLAKELNYACVSREMIIKDASESFDIPEDQLLDATSELPDPTGKKGSYSVYDIKYVQAAILERAFGNRMVYHGHGGHLLLAGIPGLLRVRIIAGMEYRIAYAVKKRNISREQAIDLIEAIDKKRILWSQRVWGVEWNDPSLYDLVISLDNVSVDSAVKIIARAAEAVEFADSDKQQQILKNALMKSRIWAALIKNKPTQSVRIELEAVDGDITIKGDVGSNKLVDAVVTVTRGVEGVKKVTSKLSVGSSWLW